MTKLYNVLNLKVLLIGGVLMLAGLLAKGQSITVPYGTPCVNNEMVFIFSGPGSCSSYSWSINNATNGVHYTIVSGGNGTASIRVRWLTAVNNVAAVCVYSCSFGSGSKASSTYNISSNVTPAVSISASSTTICQGTSVTFTASPTNGGPSPSYTWQVNGSNVSGVTGNTYTTSSLTHNQQVQAILSSSAPCLTAANATSNAITMTVNTPASQSLTITSNKSSLCAGEGIRFDVATETNIGTSPSYQWYVNGSPRSTDVNQGPKTLIINNWNYANNSTVTCVVTSTGCLTNNPATSPGISIPINSPQTFTASISTLPSRFPLTYCPGEIYFQAAASHSISGYLWYKNGVSVGSGSTYTPSSFITGDVVSLTVTSGASCLANTTASASTSGAPITIKSLVSVGAIGCDICSVGNRCQGSGTTQFSSSIQNADGITWAIENGGSSTINTSGLVSWASDFSGTATIRVTATGCAGPQSTTKNITVTPYGGIVSIGIQKNKESVCNGEGIAFEVTSEENVGTGATYEWFVNGNSRTTDVPGNPKMLIINNWTYANNSTVTCRVTSTKACTSNNPATSDPVSVPITTPQNFTASINILPSKYPMTYCQDEIYFEATSSHPAASYAWTKNGNPEILSTTQSYNPVYFVQGDYVSVTVTAASGVCLVSTQTTATTQGAPVTIYTNLSGIEIISADNGNRCQGSGTTQFSYSGTIPSPFQWTISNAGSSTINQSGLVTWDASFSGTASIQLQLIPCPSISISKAYSVNALPPTPLPITEQYCNFEHVIVRPPLQTNTSDYQFFSSTDVWLTDGSTFEAGRHVNPGTYTYKVAAVSASGCVSPGKGTISLTITDNCDEKLNWVESSSYGPANELVSQAKAYFDLAGKPLQSQSKSMSTGIIFTSGNVYDSRDRVLASSLAAPTANTQFRYDIRFLLDASGNEVADANDLNAPQAFSESGQGRIGWYYSSANTLEQKVPITKFPYARTKFYEDGTGEVLMTAAPGEQHVMGSGHEVWSGTFPVFTELDNYIQVRNTHVLPGQTSIATLKQQGVQSIARDQNGKFVLSISDKEGRTVMTARPGTWRTITNTVTLKQNDSQYLDRLYFYLLSDGPVTITPQGGATYAITNLVTNNQFTAPPAGTNWTKGFYRIDITSTGNTLAVSYSNSIGDISYSYYDDAGRMVASISPNGYQQLLVNNPAVPYSGIDKTTYIYNHRGWLISMTEPDAGRTEYMYRNDGKIRFSQNALQRERNRFSYTHYDELGRPMQSGEYKGTTMVFASAALKAKLEFSTQEIWTNGDITDWVKTTYDEPQTGVPGNGLSQTFVRGAVSQTENENIKTWYSYDELGRVKWMAQKPNAISRGFVVEYQYDFFGNVTLVAQKSFEGTANIDAFYHHYEYDADKRLIKAFTSLDGVNKKLQAKYLYYLHGPLKRIELANNLQGIDFVYNIHGWLTAINHPNELEDPGQDGSPGVHSNFRKDVFGMLLDYYASEFTGLYQASAANPDHLKIHGLPDLIESMQLESKPITFKPGLAFNSPLADEMDYKRFSVESPHYKNLIERLSKGRIDLAASEAQKQEAQRYTPEPIDDGEYTASLNSFPSIDESESAQFFIPNYTVVWKDLVGVNLINGILTKTAATGWGNSGAASENVLPAGVDGYIEFPSHATHQFMIGFSDVNVDANYNLIDYALYANGGTIYVYRNGSNPYTFTAATGDMLRIERTGSVVNFKKNGTTVHSVSGALTGNLIVDAALYAVNKSIGLITTSFWIPSTPVPNPSYDVVWADLVGVSVNGNSITKTASSGWGNAGAASVNQLQAGVDGWAEMTVPVSQTTGSIIFGLSDVNTNADYTSIDYAIYPSLVNQGVYAFENGTAKANVPYAAGDIFRVERIGSTIYYRRNGTTFYTSTIPSTSSLVVDAAINNMGHVIANAKASFWIPPAQGLVPDIWEFTTLKEFYDSLGGANWTNKTNWPVAGSWPASATIATMDTWFGIDIIDGDIGSITFSSNNNLTGKLPDEIGNLKGLRSITIVSNPNLIGRLPASIGNLSQLYYLNLFNNKFSGSIPATLNQLTGLNTLTLGLNLFTGSIPNLSALINLGALDLSNNNSLASEGIPTWIGGFTKLQNLQLSGTKRTGTIPSELQNLVNLRYLNLNSNQLTGSFPNWVGSMTYLIHIYLGSNSLSGNITLDFSPLTNLTHLIINNNQFTGSIPPSINKLTKLQYLYLQFNSFSLLPYLGDLSELLQLQINNIPLQSGPIPSWIGNLSKLTLLSMMGSNRTGAISPALANLLQIQQLLLNDNQFTGTVPAFITTLPQLRYLYLYNNQLSGEMPANWSGTPLLYYLQVSGNKFTGAIPSSLPSLSGLGIAYFHGNEFTSMPNFNLAVNKANMHIRVDNNRLDFSTIEPNYTGTNTHPFLSINSGPQKTINDVANVSIPLGTQLEIAARPLTATNTIVWEKLVGSTWTNVNASNQNTTQTTFRINPANGTHAGSYRYRITSTKVTGFTLQSDPIVVTITDVYNPGTTLAGHALYNGNITTLSWRTDPAYATGATGFKGMYQYKYDDKYQIQEAQFANPNFVLNTFQLEQNKFRETGYTYDPNGNLLTLKRYNEGQHKVHDFTYNYQALSGTNLVANSDATSTSGYSGIGSTLTQENINGQSYVKASLNQTTGNPGIRVFQVNAVAGEKYTLRIHGYENSVNGSAYVLVSSNAGGNIIWYLPTSQFASSPNTEGWVEVEFTVPAGATQIYGGINFAFSYAIGENIFINRVELFKSQARSNRLASVTGYTNAYNYNAIGQMVSQDNVTGADLYVDYDVTGKVSKVYSDALKTKLTTKYLYDDRGFRLAKETYNSTGVLQFTTWYVRDASGNVLSMYEQKAGQTQISLTEIPVYGSGKLGLYRKKLDGGFEYVYEITDHLGNVRATLKAEEEVYLATMEDTGIADATNPRVRELAYFKNLFETEKRDSRMNHTPPTPGQAYVPEWSSYLYWVNDGVAATKEDIIGPAIALKVEAGDTLYLETWAKFERKVSYTRNATTAMMASLMGSAFVNSAFGLETFTAANQAFTNNLPVALAGTGSDPATRPFAYLNYMVFNESYVLQDAGAWRVPDNAGFDPGLELTVQPQLVAFPAPIRPQQKGYVYVWVSNESEATKVWFDDVKVTHRSHRVTQATDYYAFGSTLREQRTPEELTYRYGYQGEYAEKDLETGWNHFELREFDPVIGRMTTIDPYGEFWSSYMGMGNDPISNVDPTGGEICPSCPGGSEYDVYRNSNLTYQYSELVSGDGVFQMMPELTKTLASDFGGYNFDFYNSFGSNLQDLNVFERLRKSAPSMEAQNALMRARVANKDGTVLYATLAIAAAPIVAGELIAVAPAIANGYSGLVSSTNQLTLSAWQANSSASVIASNYLRIAAYRGAVALRPIAFVTAAGGSTITNGAVERTHNALMKVSDRAKIDIYKTIKGIYDANRKYDKFDDFNP